MMVRLSGDIGNGEIDAVAYCKKYAEHLLAVKIVNWRQTSKDLSVLPDFIDELRDLILGNGDSLRGL